MRFARRLLHWMRFRAHDADLAEELAFHREAIERDLVARGHAPDEARDMARRAMGNLTTSREDSRGVWLAPRLDALWQDARITVRSLARSPTFTAGVMLTFALGVGANTAMFTLIDRMMLRPPARMRDPDAVHRVYLYRHIDGHERGTGGQYARHADITREVTRFSAVAAHVERELAVGNGAEAQELPIAVVSASFFGFFDAPPATGRYFTEAEDAPPVPAPVAVLSHALWQSRFGGSADAIGSRLQIGAATYTIVGVAPPEFVGLWPLRPPAAFIPVTAYAATWFGPGWETTYGSAFGVQTIVRRKPGVSIAEASADLQRAFIQSYRTQSAIDGTTIHERLTTLRPRALAGSILLERGPERSEVAKVATWLSGVAVIVLLIACANVATLLLVRSMARRREIAVRLALGVSRARLLTQTLTESMALAVAGSVLGLFVAVGMSRVLQTTFLPGTERVTVASDARTLGFIAVVTLVIGALAGLLPLVQVRRFAVADDLKSGARAGTWRRSRTRSALLVMQGTLSVVLLVGAGLFVRSVRHVRDVRLGFDADSVLVVGMTMRDVTLDSAATAALRLRLVNAATSAPGITHASLEISEPFGGTSSWPIFVEGIDSVEKFGTFDQQSVSPGYFTLMGTRLLRGRPIEAGDVEGAEPVIVVGASMASVLWPGQDPIGKCVRVGFASTAPCRYVVGVAEDIQLRDFGPQPENFYYYLPAAQWRPDVGGLLARARGDVGLAMEALRRRLQQEMPGESYVTVSRLNALVEEQSRSWVMGATLFTAFGALALILAAVGLYSVIAYNATQRRQELAVRVALGAAGGDVVRLIVAEGLRLALAGAVLGGAVALLVSPRIAPLLFNQSPRDPVVIGTVIGVLLLVAVIAGLLPAVRSARVDPNAALRAE